MYDLKLCKKNGHRADLTKENNSHSYYSCVLDRDNHTGFPKRKLPLLPAMEHSIPSKNEKVLTLLISESIVSLRL